MARLKTHKTNFTSGEVSPTLSGRSDLTAYENGAAQLRNVFVRPTGYVVRRSGLRYIDTVEGPARLIAFEFNTEQTYLLVFTDGAMHVYENDTRVETKPTPWNETALGHMAWTQSADTLLVTHCDLPPKRITRKNANTWEISDWQFSSSPTGRVFIPHFKFADQDIEITRNGVDGNIILTSTGHVFHPDHIHSRFRFENKEVLITDVETAGGNSEGGWYDAAKAAVIESLTGTPSTTRDWSEQAFSLVRGWPSTVTFHQDRLVIGGSKSLPNTLWFSKSSDLFNFDQGEGLDDESIEFSILSDQVNAIRGVFSGRHLQVFTSGAEWMVSGQPLTPTNIQLHRQTRIGSPVDRYIPPRDIDGATIFAPRYEDQIREFIFADVEQAYQASDLALLSRHIVKRPVDMDYDPSQRLLHVVMSDGTLGTLTVYRAEQVMAWTVQTTSGDFQGIAVVDDRVYTLVRRDERYHVEVFDEELLVDSALAGASADAVETWGNLAHLEDQSVMVVADGWVRGPMTVLDGQIALDVPARLVQAGLAYTHTIEPLPPLVSSGGNSAQGRKLRPISVTFRLEKTGALRLDVGRGLVDLPFHILADASMEHAPSLYTGDKKVRTTGWQQERAAPVWKIEQDAPLPFTLLSVTSEISVNE